MRRIGGSLLTLACVLASACSSSDGPDTLVADDTGELERSQLVGAGTDPGDITLPTRPNVTIPPPSTQPLRPLTADEIGIELDDTGRPYDIEIGWYDGGELVTEEVGPLSVPDGELRILDGSSLTVDPVAFADDATAVSLGTDVDTVDITLHELASDFEGETYAQVVAVRLDVPGRGPVVQWEPYEYAYGTDGGAGGVTNSSILAGEGASDDSPEGYFADWPLGDTYHLGTHLGGEHPDVFIYANGFGDGGFPMTRGLDANGEVAAIVLPTLTYPWRLMIDDGTPPADVSAREDEYLECIAGTRPMTEAGACLADDQFG